jgi:uncharacterized membrane protein YhhN
MMITGSLLTAFGCLFFLMSEYKHNQIGIWIFKTLAALGFIVAALGSGATSTPYGVTILIGLFLCLGGDVLLIPKSKTIFLLGIGSFLLGHIAFAIAFGRAGFDQNSALIVTVPMLILAGFILRWLWPHLDSLMQKAVPAYIAAITVMVILAVGCAVKHGAPSVAIGAIGFMFSDIAVARERFVSSNLLNKLWGTPLYFGSQIVIASTTAINVIQLNA